MKYLIALFLVGCSNSSADVVPKIPDMYCKELSTNIGLYFYRCEDKDVICYSSATINGNGLSCFKKELVK
jgi:hypothetical protein